jgi:2-polyprenyl-6-methoxyphenol hydroxylase-like FAD-dependent oxidoreductase
MQKMARETPVLIAGAGPSGLTLASELCRLGVRAMVIDRQASGVNTSRAAVIHARTLELLEPLGVTEQLIGEGVIVPRFRVRDRDRVLISIDFRTIPSAYPFTLMCPQNRTESILQQRLEGVGGCVWRPAELIRFDSNGSRVNTEIRYGESRSSVSAEWLVGCDGMHSVVRTQAKIPFVGSEYEESFVLADVRMDWPVSREEVSLFFSAEGLIVVAPLPEDRFRIVAMADVAPENPDRAYMQSLLDRRGPSSATGRIREVVWSSRFHIHHRVAEIPRKGRILLCGDAAHVHSPAGGQGMNLGIQDSVALAGALAQTLIDGDEARLDRWARDRHRVATGVVSLTDRLTRMATLKSTAGRLFRNAGIAMAGRLPHLRSALANRLAELDTR